MTWIAFAIAAALGVVLIVVGVSGSQKKLWGALTAHSSTAGTGTQASSQTSATGVSSATGHAASPYGTGVLV